MASADVGFIVSEIMGRSQRMAHNWDQGLSFSSLLVISTSPRAITAWQSTSSYFDAFPCVIVGRARAMIADRFSYHRSRLHPIPSFLLLLLTGSQQ